MRLRTKRAVFLLLLCGFASDRLSAQQAVRNRDKAEPVSGTVPTSGKRHQDPAAARLLSQDEGLSVLGAALESRVHLGAKSDCSHLVHAIYERAGFPYPYVSSSDLYAGISEFRRVTRPQPGDLVAWPGHVGIAISPVQHSFYSALHSGLGVEKYDAPYWRARGRARFYRYVKAAPGTVQAANARAARLSPATFGNAESRGDQEKAGVRTPSPAAAPEVSAVVPTVAVVDSARPSAGEITGALTQAFSDTAEALHGKDVLALPHPLIVFDELEVEQVRIERGQGWAEVRIRHTLPVTAGQVKHGKPPERQRWPLRHRDQNGWELVLPQGEIYLPRDAAVRVLAHQLTDITDNPEASSGGREKAQLARLLNALLQ
ncbi:MAG: NlpC/P60 family protein [Terriglobales bacterium]